MSSLQEDRFGCHIKFEIKKKVPIHPATKTPSPKYTRSKEYCNKTKALDVPS
jgi:hypothetical protein